MQRLIAIALLSLSTVASAEAPTAPLATVVTSSGVKWGPCPPIFPGACAMTVLQGDPAKPIQTWSCGLAPVQLCPGTSTPQPSA